MLVDLTPGAVVNGVGGALLVALALGMATLRPRRSATLLLASFSASFGAWTMLLYLVDHSRPTTAWLDVLGAALTVASGVVLLALALTWPTRLRAQRGRVLGGAAAVLAGATAVAVFGAGPHVDGFAFAFGWVEGTLGTARVFLMASFVFFPAHAATSALLALRHGVTEDATARRQIRLMSGALAVYGGLTGGVELATPGVPYVFGIGAVFALGLGASAVVWLVETTGPDGAAARTMALLPLASLLAGMILGVAFGGFRGAATAGLFGVFRTGAVAILAFAILRHQLLGVDVKIKWTLERGTVAAVFVAVFFVAAEIAQGFLSEAYGWALGGVTAGLLLFAIRPLQRMADRFAEAAMPGVRSVGEMSPDERVRLYREAAEQAWFDGSMSPDERALLDRLRVGLGIAAEDAFRIERETSVPAP